MPKVSIIVPIYKVESYLHRCMNSILAQTFTDFELILVDDGSPDNCGAICDEYAAKDARVHVIHQENGGLSAARNTGVEWVSNNSNSRWITFIDSDDWVHQQYLSMLWQGVQQYNVQICFCQAMVLNEYCHKQTTHDVVAEHRLVTVTQEQCQRFFYGATWGGIACGKLIDIAILKKYPFTRGRIYEDSAVTCKWMYEAKRIVEIDSALYFYYVNTDGISRNTFTLKQLDILWSKEEQEAFYREIGYTHMLSIVVGSYLTSAARCYRQTLDELKDRKTAGNIRIKIIKKYLANREVLRLTRQEKQYILKMLHPLMMELYWMGMAQWKKLFRK